MREKRKVFWITDGTIGYSDYVPNGAICLNLKEHNVYNELEKVYEDQKKEFGNFLQRFFKKQQNAGVLIVCNNLINICLDAHDIFEKVILEGKKINICTIVSEEYVCEK